MSARLLAAALETPLARFRVWGGVCELVRRVCDSVWYCDGPVLSASGLFCCRISEGAKWQNNSLGSKLSL